jgi:hypothetical protein
LQHHGAETGLEERRVEALALVLILLALPTQYGNLVLHQGFRSRGDGGWERGWVGMEGKRRKTGQKKEGGGEKGEKGEGRGDWRDGCQETSWRFIGLPGAPLDL